MPRTAAQEKAFKAFDDGKHLVLSGSAGTGKSFIAAYLAMDAVLEKEFRRVIIVRSVVPTRDIGFLKGSAEEKASIYEEPYRGIFAELYGRGDAYDILKHKGLVEFCTTSFIRGITLDNCVVVVDEMANCTFHELDTVITRMGDRTRIVFSGDFKQTDLLKSEDKKGLGKFLAILDRVGDFERIEYGPQDIVRSQIVKDYIIARERLEEREFQRKNESPTSGVEAVLRAPAGSLQGHISLD